MWSVGCIPVGLLGSSSGTGGRLAPLLLQRECMCVAPVLQFYNAASACATVLSML